MLKIMSTRIVDGQGRIVLPKSAREQLGIKQGDSMLVSVQRDEIVIEKQTNQIEETKTCYITGITSTNCHSFSGGIDLSEAAALFLLKELKRKQQKIGVS